MDPHKDRFGQGGQKVLEGIMNHQGMLVGPDADIVTLPFHKLDLRKGKCIQFFICLHQDLPLEGMLAVVLPQALERPVHRLEEPFEGIGLDQVIGGVQLEAFHRIFGIGRSENNQGTACKGPRKGDPGEPGHIDIQKKDIHRMEVQLVGGLHRAAALRLQLQVLHFSDVTPQHIP